MRLRLYLAKNTKTRLPKRLKDVIPWLPVYFFISSAFCVIRVFRVQKKRVFRVRWFFIAVKKQFLSKFYTPFVIFYSYICGK